MRPVLKLLACADTASSSEEPPVVLLAEPDRLRGGLIAAGLEDLGLDVVWVTHGELAVASAEERSFDVHVADPSLRTTQGERVVQVLVVEHPLVPLVVTGTSAAVIQLASARMPAADVVDLVRTTLGRQRDPGEQGLHRRSEARANP